MRGQSTSNIRPEMAYLRKVEYQVPPVMPAMGMIRNVAVPKVRAVFLYPGGWRQGYRLHESLGFDG